MIPIRIQITNNKQKRAAQGVARFLRSEVSCDTFLYIWYYRERSKSANRTAVSGSSFGASLGFHATTNRTEADFTSYPFSFHSANVFCIFCDNLATGLLVNESYKTKLA